jgi:hypothetical protein
MDINGGPWEIKGLKGLRCTLKNRVDEGGRAYVLPACSRIEVVEDQYNYQHAGLKEGVMERGRLNLIVGEFVNARREGRTNKELRADQEWVPGVLTALETEEPEAYEEIIRQFGHKGEKKLIYQNITPQDYIRGLLY